MYKKIISISLIGSMTWFPVAMAADKQVYYLDKPFYLRDTATPLPPRNATAISELYIPGKVPYADWLIKTANKVSKELNICFVQLENYSHPKNSKEEVERNWVLVKIKKKTEYIKFLNEKFENTVGAKMNEVGYAFSYIPDPTREIAKTEAPKRTEAPKKTELVIPAKDESKDFTVKVDLAKATTDKVTEPSEQKIAVMEKSMNDSLDIASGKEEKKEPVVVPAKKEAPKKVVEVKKEQKHKAKHPTAIKPEALAKKEDHAAPLMKPIAVSETKVEPKNFEIPLTAPLPDFDEKKPEAISMSNASISFSPAPSEKKKVDPAAKPSVSVENAAIVFSPSSNSAEDKKNRKKDDIFVENAAIVFTPPEDKKEKKAEDKAALSVANAAIVFSPTEEKKDSKKTESKAPLSVADSAIVFPAEEKNKKKEAKPDLTVANAAIVFTPTEDKKADKTPEAKPSLSVQNAAVVFSPTEEKKVDKKSDSKPAVSVEGAAVVFSPSSDKKEASPTPSPSPSPTVSVANASISFSPPEEKKKEDKIPAVAPTVVMPKIETAPTPSPSPSVAAAPVEAKKPLTDIPPTAPIAELTPNKPEVVNVPEHEQDFKKTLEQESKKFNELMELKAKENNKHKFDDLKQAHKSVEIKVEEKAVEEKTEAALPKVEAPKENKIMEEGEIQQANGPQF